MPRAQLQRTGTLGLTTQPTLHVGWASGLRTVREAWASRYAHKHVGPSTQHCHRLPKMDAGNGSSQRGQGLTKETNGRCFCHCSWSRGRMQAGKAERAGRGNRTSQIFSCIFSLKKLTVQWGSTAECWTWRKRQTGGSEEDVISQCRKVPSRLDRRGATCQQPAKCQASWELCTLGVSP